MFGYRIQFSRQTQDDIPNPDACQKHKPLHKFVNELIEELTKGYEIIPKYHVQ